MNITTTIPDDSVAAWQYRVDQFNAGSGQPPVDIQGFCQINRDIETQANVGAYAAYQLTQLVPKGLQYEAAPPDVKAEVDALLAAPYKG